MNTTTVPRLGAQPQGPRRDPQEVFARYLDLAPLGDRPEGFVSCCFHQERTASLHVNVVEGIFYCFGCGAGGGLRDFAARVGLPWPGATDHAPRRPATLRELVREEGARLVRAHHAYQAAWTTPERDEDDVALGACRSMIRRARDRVTALGDVPAAWELAACAARAEMAAEAFEAAGGN